MKLRNVAAMISTANDYSSLKWPLTIVSFLLTVLAFILILSFRSEAWFTYEITNIDNHTKSSHEHIKYIHLLEYGSFGLWKSCSSQNDHLTLECDRWTRVTRPQNFSVIMALVSCVLFIANLTFFPSWALTVLTLYNASNRYIRHIVALSSILLVLTLALVGILIGTMILVGLTKFYSPGKFIMGTNHLSFFVGPGVIYLITATILSIICLLLVIISFIWKQMITMRLDEDEKELVKQLTDDNYQPGWHKPEMISRSATPNNGNRNEPPPYDRYETKS